LAGGLAGLSFAGERAVEVGKWSVDTWTAWRLRVQRDSAQRKFEEEERGREEWRQTDPATRARLKAEADARRRAEEQRLEAQRLADEPPSKHPQFDDLYYADWHDAYHTPTGIAWVLGSTFLLSYVRPTFVRSGAGATLCAQGITSFKALTLSVIGGGGLLRGADNLYAAKLKREANLLAPTLRAIKPTSSTPNQPTPSTPNQPTSSTFNQPTSSTPNHPTPSTPNKPTSSTLSQPAVATTIQPPVETTKQTGGAWLKGTRVEIDGTLVVPMWRAARVAHQASWLRSSKFSSSLPLASYKCQSRDR
jgi:hypothetical protein